MDIDTIYQLLINNPSNNFDNIINYDDDTLYRNMMNDGYSHEECYAYSLSIKLYMLLNLEKIDNLII